MLASSLISRRSLMKAIGAAAFVPSAVTPGRMPLPQVPAPPVAGWCPEGPDTPKLTLDISPQADAAAMRRLKQIGIDHVNSFGPRIPWREDQIRSLVASLRSGGLTLGNMMIDGFPNALLRKARAGRGD